MAVVWIPEVERDGGRFPVERLVFPGGRLLVKVVYVHAA